MKGHAIHSVIRSIEMHQNGLLSADLPRIPIHKEHYLIHLMGNELGPSESGLGKSLMRCGGTNDFDKFGHRTHAKFFHYLCTVIFNGLIA